HVGQPQRIQVMGQGEDHVVMVTSQQPGLLEGEPMLGLEIGALWTGPVPTGVVPDAGHMDVRTRLDMAGQRGRPALRVGARGFADVRRQGMGVFIGGKGLLEDRLQRDEGHRCLRTYGIRASPGCFVQYHANYPRCKRLVQPSLSDLGGFRSHRTATLDILPDLEMPIRLANPQVLKIGVFFPSFYRVIDGVYSCGWSSQSTKMEVLSSRKRSNSKVEYCESPLVPKNKQDRDVCARGLRSARCCTGQWDQCGFTHDTNGRGHRDGLCCPGMVS